MKDIKKISYLLVVLITTNLFLTLSIYESYKKNKPSGILVLENINLKKVLLGQNQSFGTHDSYEVPSTISTLLYITVHNFHVNKHLKAK